VAVLKKKLVDEDVLTLARRRIARLFDEFDLVAVSFSGGKDSTVALNLTVEEAERRGRLPLDVVFWDEEALPPETIEYCERVSRDPRLRFRWYCLPVQHRNACSRTSPYWHPWAPESQSLWCRDLPQHALTVLNGFNRQPLPLCNGLIFPDRSRRVAVVMGIRADESLRRYRSVAHRTEDNWFSTDPEAPHVTLAKPIYDWRTDDVWTAPLQLGWDYNRTYDVLSRLGIPKHSQRVCPPYGEEPLRGLWMYAQGWPGLWEKMTRRVPGARTAARYSRSPLYAFGDEAAAKPDGVTWQEAITKALDMWEPETRAKVAHRLRLEIERHFLKNPGLEIPESDAGAAVGGLTWEFLYMLAQRGDLKKRRDSSSKETQARQRVKGGDVGDA
jgi:predicted phosphoadenosine phosphosulfate sulfurtransferase